MSSASGPPAPPVPGGGVDEETNGAGGRRFLSREALAREPHALRSLAPLLLLPDICWLAGGLPSGSVFPFTSFSATTRDGMVIELGPQEMYAAQQYMMTDAGYTPLVGWVEAHVRAVHAPPRPVAHLVTCGSTNGVDLALRCLADRGDAVVVEEHTYSATLQAMRPLGLEVLSVPTDGEGPVPGALRQLCDSRRARGLAPVRLMYAVPVSGNPTGVSWSPARCAAVYALACEFDFPLIEDDAYYYLQFDRTPGAPQPGLKGLSRSLLSLDVEGRVVRLDACSKVLAPGLRVGWATAPPAVMGRMVRAMQSAVQGANSLAQILVHRLLSGWGPGGLEAHLVALQAAYAARCTALLACAERHLGASVCGGCALATWQPPRAGMFLWLTLAPCVGVADAGALQAHLTRYKVAVVPGRVFRADPAQPSPCMRLSFASASEDDFDRGMHRLAQLLRARADEARGCATPVGVW